MILAFYETFIFNRTTWRHVLCASHQEYGVRRASDNADSNLADCYLHGHYTRRRSELSAQLVENTVSHLDIF